MEDYEIRDVMNRLKYPVLEPIFNKRLLPGYTGELHEYELQIKLVNLGPLVINNFLLEFCLPEKMIKDCDYFIALLTRDGQRSLFVNYEIGVAKGLNKPIIPLLEKGVQIPPHLKGKEVIFFSRTDPEQTIEWLMDYLNYIRKEKAKAALMSALASLGLIAIIGIGLLGLFGLSASEVKKA